MTTRVQQHQKIIFGLKVRELRQGKGITFKQLQEKTGMSLSYLNEIEKGKKYPKTDKIELLADALDESVENLTSLELRGSLLPIGELLKSNFLNELPLDIFGLELTKIVEMIAYSPTKVGAFISTLVDLAKHHSVGEANFFNAAVKSYQELNFNYFEDIEKAALDFVKQYDIPTNGAVSPEILEEVLVKKFKYKIIEDGLDDNPAISHLRSVFIPDSRKLLLNKNISRIERIFQYGKEIAFQHMKMEERATTSSLTRIKSFDQVLNHFKAVYFTTAILINKNTLSEDLQILFDQAEWNSKNLTSIIEKYQVSPEILLARLTNILPKYLDLKKFFFIRFVHDKERDVFHIDKELHLNNKHYLQNKPLEHYCRRISSVSLIDKNQTQKYGPSIEIQRIRFYGTEDEYLIFVVKRGKSGVNKYNSSATLGLLLDNKTKRTIRFAQNKNIKDVIVNNTCERCPIEDCKERAAAPVVIERRAKRKEQQKALEELIQKHRK